MVVSIAAYLRSSESTNGQIRAFSQRALYGHTRKIDCWLDKLELVVKELLSRT